MGRLTGKPMGAIRIIGQTIHKVYYATHFGDHQFTKMIREW